MNLQILFFIAFSSTVIQDEQNLILAGYFAFALWTMKYHNQLLMQNGAVVVQLLCVGSVINVALAVIYQVRRASPLPVEALNVAVTCAAVCSPLL